MLTAEDFEVVFKVHPAALRDSMLATAEMFKDDPMASDAFVAMMGQMFSGRDPSQFTEAERRDFWERLSVPCSKNRRR